MRLEARKYLYDIQEAAKLIAEFTAGKDFAAYERDAMMRLAVERAFSIIGEALVQLARVDEMAAARITDRRSITAFRNILIHAYAQVDDKIVWGIVESKVATLMHECGAVRRRRGRLKPGTGRSAGTARTRVNARRCRSVSKSARG